VRSLATWSYTARDNTCYQRTDHSSNGDNNIYLGIDHHHGDTSDVEHCMNPTSMIRDEIMDLLDHLTPHQQAGILNTLLTKYGVPRTLMVEILGLLEIDDDAVQSMVADIPLIQR